ncbi:MAG: FKBP-type peptidyl-prolyl cis-trans isomerase [Planctomycetaceae bacterium]
MSARRRRRPSSSDRLRLEPLEPRQVLASFVAVGSEINAAGGPLVRLVNAETGQVAAEILAFEQAFRGGVRVAMANVDGVAGDEILAASGPGRTGEIRVFQAVTAGATTTLRELPAFRLLPFGPGYRGGVELAAGDLDGDRNAEIVAAKSYGSRVNVFRASAIGAPPAATPSQTFRPFDREHLGGATVAVGDFGTFSDGRTVDATRPDGRLEIVVGSGGGVRPTVTVYDASAATPRAVDQIRPFAAQDGFIGGVSVTTGRYDADAIDDMVVSSGAGGPGTEVYDGRVAAGDNTRLARFAAFANLPRARAAAFATGIDRNGDGRIDGFVATQGLGGSGGTALVSQAGVRTQAFATAPGALRVGGPRISLTDFTTTLSGIQYRVTQPGSGSIPTAGQTVQTHYTGWLLDGSKFDSSRDRGTPFSFVLGQGQVIAGWDELIATMRPGERRTAIIPANLAYGSTARPGIPANSPLVFDIELLSAS